jgi:hypothetical protein
VSVVICSGPVGEVVVTRSGSTFVGGGGWGRRVFIGVLLLTVFTRMPRGGSEVVRAARVQGLKDQADTPGEVFGVRVREVV